MKQKTVTQQKELRTPKTGSLRSMNLQILAKCSRKQNRKHKIQLSEIKKNFQILEIEKI